MLKYFSINGEMENLINDSEWRKYISFQQKHLEIILQMATPVI